MLNMTREVEPLTCDVLVIGAGPAGSTAARFAAQRGLSVILLERRERVGFPVRCAEYVPLPVGYYVDLNHPGLMAQSVRGMETHIPGEPVKKTMAPGAMINRDLFDQVLADLAVAAGACLKTGFQARTYSGDRVLAEGPGESLAISCRIIIGADGPCSQAGRWMGSRQKEFLRAAEYRVSLNHLLDHTRTYFRPYLKGGYGWLFPKGKVANVGIGVAISQTPDLGLILNQFRQELINEGLIGEDILWKGGGLVPVGGLTKVAQKNLILAGDAAGTCHPITGAGVANALVSGEMAGQAAAQAVLKGDLRPLQEYGRELVALLGHSLSHGVRKRKVMMEQWVGADFTNIIQDHWVAFKKYYR